MKETLTKKIGPLPLYVWAGLGVVIIGAFILWKRSQSSSSASASNPASTTGSSQLPAGSGYAVVGGYGQDQTQGYNNNGPGPSGQGPTSTVVPQSTFQQLIGGSAPGSTMTQVKAVMASGQQLYTELTQGVFAPYVLGSTPINSPVYILQPASGPISGIAGGGVGPPVQGTLGASSATSAPGVVSQPGQFQSLPATPLNPGSPASAIAPSALQPVTQ